MNLATLPDITEEILQEDNDKKEKVREDHLEEKSKSDKIQIVNDKTELSDIAKGGFFSESAMCFFKSPNLQNNIFQKTILNLTFNFHANNSICNWRELKFQSQDSFWNIFILEISRF